MIHDNDQSFLMIPGERVFIMMENVVCNYKVENRYKTLMGEMLVTNYRFLINDDITLDIPLATIEDEKFVQPIFGCNYLKGTTPFINDESKKINWKIYMIGYGSLTPILMEMCRKAKQKHKEQTTRTLTHHTYNVAYIDPNNPCDIILCDDS